MLANRLIPRDENKWDLDSDYGQDIFKNFLETLERLYKVSELVTFKSLKIKTVNRTYRSKFSKAYTCLYKEGNLCFLTEIIDSAQEGIECLWVNGNKYSFSKDTLDMGNKLNSSLKSLIQTLKQTYKR